MNNNVIQNGVVAVVSVTIASGVASTAINVINLLGASAGGAPLPMNGVGGIVTVAPPPPPSVGIESPTAGTIASGTMMVTGWAVDNTSGVGSAISTIQVLVDGVKVGNATYGGRRPDICSVFPGRPGCPNVGFTYALNTSNLSSGMHLITVSATDTDATPDSGSASVSISVPVAPPSVYIDSPTTGATVSDVITVRGWAIDNTSSAGTAINSVQVLVDGTKVGNATYGGSRPDVCGVYPGRSGCPNVGFMYLLDTKQLAPGTHTLTAMATDTDGTPDSGSWTVNIAVVVPPSVWIEGPTNGSTASGTITVSGWAIDNTSTIGSAIGSVQIQVDGSNVGTATYGISRPDVCSAFPGRPGCPNVGFSYLLNTAMLTPGSHTITVSATDTDGIPDTGSTSVTVTVGAVPPSVLIDSPLTGTVASGAIAMSGWAIDNTVAAGTSIGSVQVLADGVKVGNATYGLSRPDVCTVYPGRPGCPNVGFYYVLNTATLSAGPHAIMVSASDSDSAPDSGSASITITVAATPPSVYIDLPAAGASVTGIVLVSGWAIDNAAAAGTAIASVQVLVDGTKVGTATYGSGRPDVCSAFPARPSCPNVGFWYLLDTSKLTVGSHSLTVSATDTDSTPDSGSWTITINVH